MKRTTQILVINVASTKDILSKIEVVYRTPAWLSALKTAVTTSNNDFELIGFLDPIEEPSKKESSAGAIHKYLNKMKIPFTRSILSTDTYNQVKARPKKEKVVKKTKATKRNK